MKRDATVGSRGGRGFTLIEVLIAIVILAVGLISLARLFVFGVQNNKSAHLRTVATQQAYDMADRMRANMAALIATPAGYDKPAATQTAACRTTAGCTPAQMAAHDFFEWNNAASAVSNPVRLPNGTGIVCIDSTPNDGSFDGATVTDGCDAIGTQYAIKIWWRDDRSVAATGTSADWRRFVTVLQPQL
jgi:type IV pilus assembly protein PilV